MTASPLEADIKVHREAPLDNHTPEKSGRQKPQGPKSHSEIARVGVGFDCECAAKLGHSCGALTVEKRFAASLAEKQGFERFDPPMSSSTSECEKAYSTGLFHVASPLSFGGVSQRKAGSAPACDWRKVCELSVCLPVGTRTHGGCSRPPLGSAQRTKGGHGGRTLLHLPICCRHTVSAWFDCTRVGICHQSRRSSDTPCRGRDIRIEISPPLAAIDAFSPISASCPAASSFA
jgi:hypothetical protein